uniref:DNA repair endonuclease XPF n=1 Tax=Panagrellus redivivus TaxID=6233 RepID=A0A7E4VU71_PANRE
MAPLKGQTIDGHPQSPHGNLISLAKSAPRTTKPSSDIAGPATPTTSKSADSGSAMIVILNHGDKYNLINALENLKPSFIILYHLDVASLRIIETYNAVHSEKKLRIYTVMYKESAEEERYLLGIHREQNAFETLIREQGVLMVPNAYDVSRESTSKLRQLSLAKDSRTAVSASDLTNRVIIDMREFNSELPTFLYKRGVELDAVTLEVGDYILAPIVAVERKALDDLAQSLGNGRIFKQIEQMLRHYPRTILLIESSDKFKHRKVNGGPFQGELSRRSRETRSLLAMLIRAHPRMSCLWSVNPRCSAELFEEVKIDEPNPDIDAAAMIRSTDLGTNSTPSRVKPNPVVKRALTNLRGLGSGDVDSLMASDDFRTPLDLFTGETDALSEALGNINMAQKLGDFFAMDFRYL